MGKQLNLEELEVWGTEQILCLQSLVTPKGNFGWASTVLDYFYLLGIGINSLGLGLD